MQGVIIASRQFTIPAAVFNPSDVSFIELMEIGESQATHSYPFDLLHLQGSVHIIASPLHARLLL